jgi:hypothetical protein
MMNEREFCLWEGFCALSVFFRVFCVRIETLYLPVSADLSRLLVISIFFSFVCVCLRCVTE